MKNPYKFYTIHRGGRTQSVDYFEHHVHAAVCECPTPTQDTPRVIWAESVQEAVDLVNATMLSRISHIEGTA